MAAAITAKELKISIKNGLTIDDLCAKHGYANEDECIGQISFYLPRTASKLIMELRQNEKKHRRVKRKSVTAETAEANPQKGGMQMDRLTELQKLETSQSDFIISLENQHKELATKHKNCLKHLRSLKEAMDQLEREYEEKGLEYDQTVAKNNEFVTEMNRISKELSEKRSELTATRQQIKDLERISIFVYADGKFEVIEGTIDLDFTGAGEIFDQLVRDERCETLTIKQIRTLAKVLVISRSNSNIEFTFDEESIKHVYTLTSQMSPNG